MNENIKFPEPIRWITISVDWQEIKPKCECGYEKVKILGHSTWCPKYEELKI